MYRSARVTDLIIDSGTFPRLLQKGGRRGKVSAGGKQLRGKQKGEEAEEEEEEGREMSQGESSTFVSRHWLFLFAGISIFQMILFFNFFLFLSTDNSSSRLPLSCAGFHDLIWFFSASRCCRISPSLSCSLSFSHSLSLTHTLSLSQTQLYFLKAIPPTSCSLLIARGGSGSVQWLFSAFKSKDRHLAPKINK